MINTIQNLYAFIIDMVSTFTGDNPVWLLYPPAMITILVLAPKQMKKLFAGTFALELVTVFNPFVADFLVEHLGFESRYSRVMWMLVFYVTIGYAFMLVIFLFRQRVVRLILVVLSAALIVGIGTPVFTEKKAGTAYTRVQNKDFTVEEIKQMYEIFHSQGIERPVVLYREYFASYRLYDPSVISVLTRAVMLDSSNNDWESFRKKKVYTKAMKRICRVYLCGDYTFSVRKFYNALLEYDTNYIVSNSPEMFAYLSQSKRRFRIVASTANQTIWKVRRIKSKKNQNTETESVQ